MIKRGKNMRHYIKNQAGAIAIAFALMGPIIVGSAGVALDYAQAYMVKQRLQQAIDASALAAAASSNDATEIENKIEDFFEANYPPEKLGATFDPVVTVTNNQVIVSGQAYYHTTFGQILGFDTIDVDAETAVNRQVQGLEVVLVMDNTGSMSTNNNIGTLRTAATSFVNIMFNNTTDADYIKIGLVPYSTSVNVGPYGLGEDTDGGFYDAAFVNNPHGFDYDESDSSQWQGCVLAADYPDDTLDHEGPWDMYRYCRDGNENLICDTRTQQTCTGKGKKKKCTYTTVARRNPNYICPVTSITPLTSNQENLLSSIETMQANGHTYGNFGMVWGGRVLSPEYPFEEGSSWTHDMWQKAIVMMTDGVNTMHSNYSAYGPTADHDINPGDLNERFAEVCEDLKDKGVTVYTVTFAGGVNENTKNYYRECATTEDQYYDAPSQEDLVAVFEQISRELSNLYLSR